MVHRQDRKSACSVVDAWVLLRQRTDGTKRHRNASDVVGVWGRGVLISAKESEVSFRFFPSG